MRINLITDDFTEVTITSGTLQNISPQASVEVASTATKNTGIILPPYATLSYSDNATVYARNAWDDDSTCVIAVEPFKKAGKGGEYTLPIATSSKLGGVKIGSNLSIDENGVLSASGGGSSDYDPVGRVVFDVILRDGYIKANGATVADASTSIPNLLQFVQDNSATLLAANQAAYDANHGLYLYDSETDTLTLPSFIGKFVEGGNSVESIEAGLPNIKGNVTTGFFQKSWGSSNGAISYGVWDSNKYLSLTNNSLSDFGAITLNAHNSNSIYLDTVNTVQPPAITLIPQIKY